MWTSEKKGGQEHCPREEGTTGKHTHPCIKGKARLREDLAIVAGGMQLGAQVDIVADAVGVRVLVDWSALAVLFHLRSGGRSDVILWEPRERGKGETISASTTHLEGHSSGQHAVPVHRLGHLLCQVLQNGSHLFHRMEFGSPINVGAVRALCRTPNAL